MSAVDLQGLSYQRSRSIPTSDGSYVNANFNRRGNLGQMHWVEDLVLQGYVWRFKVGAGPGAGGDATGTTGGGNGTTIDGDQPDMIISNSDAAWCLIPIDLRIDSVALDIDADGEYGAALWCVDYTAATAAVAGTNNTAGTGINLLGNGTLRTLPSAVVLASIQSADITDPVISDVLAVDRIQAADVGTAASNSAYGVHARYDGRDFPYIIRGPSAIYGYWGGTAAVTAIASATFAYVPWELYSA